VFAYGQTASGKTFTIRGCDQSPGIIPQCITELYKEISKINDRVFQVKVSYLELYNETINDLLTAENADLEIRENLHGVYVKGLTEFEAQSPEQALNKLFAGDAIKKVGETKLNEQSSRSHTVFRLSIQSKQVGASPTMPARVSQLNLVDLAGSEGVSKTKAEGVRLREGVTINKSLLALSNVIHRLSSSKEKFINYRDSKLTRMLQPALGGNSKTAIICTISQTRINYQETINTMLFGVKAKKIKNNAKVNEIVPDNHKRLQLALKEIQNLKEELKILRNGKKSENLFLIENISTAWQNKVEALRDMLVSREVELDKKKQIIHDFDDIREDFVKLSKSLTTNDQNLIMTKENTILPLNKQEINKFIDQTQNLITMGVSDGTPIGILQDIGQDMDIVEADGIKLLDIEDIEKEIVAPGKNIMRKKASELEQDLLKEKDAREEAEREKEQIKISAEQTLSESIEECENLYNELKETIEIKDKFQAELILIKAELEEMKKNDNKAELEAMIKKQENEILFLRNESYALKQKISNYQNEMKKKDETIALGKENNEQLKKEIEKLYEENKQLNNQLKSKSMLNLRKDNFTSAKKDLPMPSAKKEFGSPRSSIFMSPKLESAQKPKKAKTEIEIIKEMVFFRIFI